MILYCLILTLCCFVVFFLTYRVTWGCAPASRQASYGSLILQIVDIHKAGFGKWSEELTVSADSLK